MKKLIVMALGLGLALGSISFAQDTSTSTKKTKAKKTKAKKTDASTSKM
jgi:hypothetical protein